MLICQLKMIKSAKSRSPDNLFTPGGAFAVIFKQQFNRISDNEKI